MANKKLKSPYFVTCKIVNGECELTDDDGEIWIVMMHPDQEVPMICQQVPQREMRAARQKRLREILERKPFFSSPVPPDLSPPPPFRPHLVSDKDK